MGYYVMTYGGGRYTSIAWHFRKEDAEAHVNHIIRIGYWSGEPPKIEAA